ncbi:MAG: LysM peptidoglycan-binding domain-containing protein [Planctomycetota bacterium]
MGYVERYGLLVLFILCALIIGCGIFGGDGQAVKADEKRGGASVPAGAKAGPSLDGLNGPGTREEREPQREQEDAAVGDAREGQEESLPDPSPYRLRTFSELRQAGGRLSAEGGGIEPPKVFEGSSEEAQPLEQGKRSYVIRKGDTLGEIAQRELGSSRFVKEILARNPGIDPLKLAVGNEIELPLSVAGGVGPNKPTFYTVKRGDTLEGIALRLLGDRTRARLLARTNGMALEDALSIGKRLRIPEPGKK